MVKIKLITRVLLVFMITSLHVSFFTPVFANPAPVHLMYYSGGLVPNENVSISILHAEVLIHADTSNLDSLGEMKFSGNYTIFNHGSHLNISIAAPFLFYPTNNCSILVNGSITPYLLYYEWEDEAESWNPYLVNRSELSLYDHFWLVINVSIPENVSLELQYRFSTPSNLYFTKWGRYYLIYDVGTSRLWNGNITEHVEINIHGNLPNTIYNEEECVVQDIYDGKNYNWNWDNKRISVNYVGVSYYFDNRDNNEYNVFFVLLIATPLGVLSLITYITFKILKSRTSKKLKKYL